MTGWPVDIIATDYISYSIEFSCFPNGTSVDSEFDVQLIFVDFAFVIDFYFSLHMGVE